MKARTIQEAFSRGKDPLATMGAGVYQEYADGKISSNEVLIHGVESENIELIRFALNEKADLLWYEHRGRLGGKTRGLKESLEGNIVRITNATRSSQVKRYAEWMNKEGKRDVKRSSFFIEFEIHDGLGWSPMKSKTMLFKERFKPLHRMEEEFEKIKDHAQRKRRYWNDVEERANLMLNKIYNGVRD